MRMKKLLIGFLCVALTLTLLAACGGEDDPSPTQSPAASDHIEKTVAPADLMDSLVAADPSLPEMDRITDRDEDAELQFAVLSDLDYEKVEGYAQAFAADGQLADEISVILFRSAADLPAAEQSARERLAARREVYAAYAPREADRLDDAVIFTRGRYLVVIICNDAAAVRNTFEAQLG